MAERRTKVTVRLHESEDMIIVIKRNLNDKGQWVKLSTLNLSFKDAMMIGKTAEQEQIRRYELGLLKNELR